MVIRGYLQEFADGSAGYWKELKEQAKPAPSLQDAFKRVFIIELGLGVQGNAAMKATATSVSG